MTFSVMGASALSATSLCPGAVLLLAVFAPLIGVSIGSATFHYSYAGIAPLTPDLGTQESDSE